MKINAIKDSCENNIPFPNPAMMEKQDKIAKLTEEMELDEVALRFLKDTGEQKSFFADFFNFLFMIS